MKRCNFMKYCHRDCWENVEKRLEIIARLTLVYVLSVLKVFDKRPCFERGMQMSK